MAAVIVVALAVPAGLALRTIWGQGGDDDVHERLVDALDELDVGDLILVAEQQFGVSDVPHESVVVIGLTADR